MQTIFHMPDGPRLILVQADEYELLMAMAARVYEMLAGQSNTPTQLPAAAPAPIRRVKHAAPAPRKASAGTPGRACKECGGSMAGRRKQARYCEPCAKAIDQRHKAEYQKRKAAENKATKVKPIAPTTPARPPATPPARTEADILAARMALIRQTDARARAKRGISAPRIGVNGTDSMIGEPSADDLAAIRGRRED